MLKPSNTRRQSSVRKSSFQYEKRTHSHYKFILFKLNKWYHFSFCFEERPRLSAKCWMSAGRRIWEREREKDSEEEQLPALVNGNQQISPWQPPPNSQNTGDGGEWRKWTDLLYNLYNAYCTIQAWSFFPVKVQQPLLLYLGLLSWLIFVFEGIGIIRSSQLKRQHRVQGPNTILGLSEMFNQESIIPLGVRSSPGASTALWDSRRVCVRW